MFNLFALLARCAQIRNANVYNLLESSSALLVSFVINLFVVVVFAEAFHDPTAPDSATWHLSEAAARLMAKFGPAAKYVWAIGLLASGQSSTMTGVYSGQVCFGCVLFYFGLCFDARVV